VVAGGSRSGLNVRRLFSSVLSCGGQRGCLCNWLSLQDPFQKNDMCCTQDDI
jgi:hypothetical protein